MNTVLELSANLFDSVLAFYFLKKFIGDKLSVPFFVFMAAHFAATTVLTWVETFSYFPSIVNLIIMLAYTVTRKGSPLIRRILGPFIFETLLIALNSAFMFVTSYLSGKAIAEILSLGVAERYICIWTSKIALLTVAMIILRISSHESEYTFGDLLVYIVFPLATVFELGVFMKIGMQYDLDRILPLAAGAVIGVAAIDVFAYLLYKRLTERQKALLEVSLQNGQLESERKMYSEAKDSYERMLMLRHDIGGQLNAISGIIESGDRASAEKCIETLRERVDKIAGQPRTGNVTIDYIINSKVAPREDISVFFMGTSVFLDGYDTLDIASLFGNIIDNALEALEKAGDRRLIVDLFVKNEMQNIIVKNSVASSVLSGNPGLASTKADRRNHGYGTKIIKQITDKYSGMQSFFEEDGMFGVHVILPTSQNKNQ